MPCPLKIAAGPADADSRQRRRDPTLVPASAALAVGGASRVLPALVALGSGSTKAWVFVAAVLGGMAAFELLERLQHTRQRA